MLKQYTNKVLDFITISFMSAVLSFHLCLSTIYIFGIKTEGSLLIGLPSPVIAFFFTAISIYLLYLLCKWMYKILKKDTRISVHFLLAFTPFILFISLACLYFLMIYLTEIIFGFQELNICAL